MFPGDALPQLLRHAFIELDVVENPTFVIGNSILYVIVREI